MKEYERKESGRDAFVERFRAVLSLYENLHVEPQEIFINSAGVEMFQDYGIDTKEHDVWRTFTYTDENGNSARAVIKPDTGDIVDMGSGRGFTPGYDDLFNDRK